MADLLGPQVVGIFLGLVDSAGATVIQADDSEFLVATVVTRDHREFGPYKSSEGITNTKDRRKSAFSKAYDALHELLKAEAVVFKEEKERLKRMADAHKIDYVQYSRMKVLPGVEVFLNDLSLFKNLVSGAVVALDSEGEGADGPLIYQLCHLEADVLVVYVYDNFQVNRQHIRDLLSRDDVVKIVCDRGSEQKRLNYALAEPVFDVQLEFRQLFPSRNTKVGLVDIVTAVSKPENPLRKAPEVRCSGWNSLASIDSEHLDYAVADVLWLMRLWQARNQQQ